MSEEEQNKKINFEQRLLTKFKAIYNKSRFFGTNILRYATELLIVAFGVFSGTYVSEWKSNERNEVKAIKSLNYMVRELENNHNNLQLSIKYYAYPQF